MADPESSVLDANQFLTFEELLEAICRSMHGALEKTGEPSRAHLDSFPTEYHALTVGKPLVSPELNETTALICVGGRLHPIVLDPKHPITNLHKKQYNTKGGTPLF